MIWIVIFLLFIICFLIVKIYYINQTLDNISNKYWNEKLTNEELFKKFTDLTYYYKNLEIEKDKLKKEVLKYYSLCVAHDEAKKAKEKKIC